MSIINDFSKFIWLFSFKLKSQAPQIILQFIKLVTNFFGRSLISIQTDNGTDFKSLTPLLQNLGISPRLTCPYLHQQNGSVEFHHRRIVEIGLTLLKNAFLPVKFWDYAFQTPVYLINRLPSPITSNESVYSILFQKSPDYKFLEVFACLCFPNLRPYNAQILAYRSNPMIFLRYSPHNKG